MSPIIASWQGGVNPSCLEISGQSVSDMLVKPPQTRVPVTAGCAAAPRFIQVHPRLLELRPPDLATYVLLCERTITGLYPAGVPLSGTDLASFFEADESAAAGTRYTRALKRLVEAELVVRESHHGRKTCYAPRWPGTQRRDPAPVSTPYPHRLFVPIYLRLLEEFIGTIHPSNTGPAHIVRYVEKPRLDPVALHAWATARWAAWRNLPAPSIEAEVVEQLRAVGLWDDTGVFDPEHPRKSARKTTPAPQSSQATPPLITTEGGDSSSITAAAWSMLNLMAQQMRLMQEQITTMQRLLLGEASDSIIPVEIDRVQISALESTIMALGLPANSANTDLNTNTEIKNTEKTREQYHPQTPNRRRQQDGGGDETKESLPEKTEAERLLLQEGVLASNAHRFADRHPEQVIAAINFAKSSRHRFDNPAGMIVWLLEKNEFADAHERPDTIMATSDETQARCWYCGKAGCTACNAEQEQRLRLRWSSAEFDGTLLWRDLQAAAREALPELPVEEVEARVVRGERLILVADEEAAMALRTARSKLVELAAKRLDVKVDVVITRRPSHVLPLPLPGDPSLPLTHNPPTGEAETSSSNGECVNLSGHSASNLDFDSSHTDPIGQQMKSGAAGEYTPTNSNTKPNSVPGSEAGLVTAPAPSTDDALKAAAAGLPLLVQALFTGARVEPGTAEDAETVCLHTRSPLAAERLRKQPAIAERVVGAALGRPVHVTIRGPDPARPAARRAFWR